MSESNPGPDLSKVFSADIKTLVTEFIADFDLKYEEKDLGLSNPLLRWLDFTSRYITPRPRQVRYSNCVSRSINKENRAAFKRIVLSIKSGVDLNPYQSKGLTLFNDTSGKNKQKRTDHLLAHWGIHHLHLVKTRPSKDKYFSDRSPWLLFCIFGEDFAGIIDIRHHNEDDLFSDPELVKTIANNWPDLMEPYRIKNMISITGANRTASEIADARKVGMNMAIEVDGKFYMSPGGITTALTPLGVTTKLLKINRIIEQLADELSNPNSRWREAFTENNSKELDLHIALHEKGLCIYDRSSDRVTLLPRTKDEPNNEYARLHELLLPKWAFNFLIKKHKTKVYP